jgi:hypothetical protein
MTRVGVLLVAGYPSITSQRSENSSTNVYYTFEGLGQYSVEIDREVYNYLEQVYKQERVLMDEKTQLVFDAYNTVPFDALFPDVHQY